MNTQENNDIAYEVSSNPNIQDGKLQQEMKNPVINEEVDNKDVLINDINNSHNQDMSN